MRSEAWRPAAAARNRLPREARDPALQALRPGCEELAVTDPEPAMLSRASPSSRQGGGPPVREARPRSLKPPRWSAERRASRVMANVPSTALHTTPLGCGRSGLILAFDTI